jgi:hypothetical protein
MNGNVTIDKVGIIRASSGHGVIYLGDSFATSANITIDLASVNVTTQWNTARDILKGGTPSATTGITGTQMEKFTLGKMFSDTTFITEYTSGTIALFLQGTGSTAFGYAKWTAP